MEHTFETISKISLVQLIDELQNFKTQKDSGTNKIYLKDLSSVDMLYLVRNHPQKDKIPHELVRYYEDMMEECEMDMMMRHTGERIAENRYYLHRLVCLSAFYVEREVFCNFWKKNLMALRPYVLSEIHKEQTMKKINNISIDVLKSEILIYLSGKYPFTTKLSLSDIFYLMNTHKDKKEISDNDRNLVEKHVIFDYGKEWVPFSERNEYHYAVYKMIRDLYYNR